jgi:hypothetical protein
MATPVILQMNVHCNGCARKIRRTARSVDGEWRWEHCHSMSPVFLICFRVRAGVEGVAGDGGGGCHREPRRGGAQVADRVHDTKARHRRERRRRRTTGGCRAWRSLDSFHRRRCRATHRTSRWGIWRRRPSTPRIRNRPTRTTAAIGLYCRIETRERLLLVYATFSFFNTQNVIA